ncbi:MAG: tetratricopeptide repeat protein, partial [Kofleriaceae bacterium]
MQNEIVAAGEELIQAATLSTEDRDRVRRLADAAWVFRHRLRDTERARQCLHLILELEPEHVDAKQALAELLHATEQWESLWPHLEQQLARAPALGATEQLDIYTRAARCALELDRFEMALELFDQACALDPGPALAIERAEALYRARSLEAAAAAYQTILLGHAAAIGEPALLAAYRRLAEIHTTLGKTAQAVLFHRKVLELSPLHRGTLQDLVDLELARGRVDEAIVHLRTLVGVVEPAERVPYLERIGDLYRDRQHNAPRAMSAYLEALELDAGNRRVLQRVLDLQSAAGQWRGATETIERFLEHETDPGRRAAYYLASAEIRRNELRDKPGALEAYDRALAEMFREDPLTPATRARGLDTFRLIDELVTAERNWKHLEQSYLRMVKRVPKGDPVLLPLWHALGEIYRTRLKQYDNAIRAFEVARALDPDKLPERASVLAELYSLVGRKQPAQVAERAAKLVEADPEHPDAYRALGRASLAAGNIDEAWCVARALVFLKKANDEEQALYERFASHEADKATGILDDDTWAAAVRHPEEDRSISALFALVWEAAVASRAGAPKAFELKPKERLPVEDGTRVIAKIFRHAARVLNVALPDVYVQPRRSGRLLLANCIERGRLVPAVIVGRDLMTGYRDTELAAVVGAILALLRPAYWLRLALPSLE